MADFAENTFCSLCGVLIEPHDGTPVNEDNSLPWNSEVRAIRTRQSYQDPFVTGIGYLNFHREVIADLRTDVAHTASNVELQAHELGQGPHRYWCFPVHEACWQLLYYRVESWKRNITSDTIARHLFAILYNTPTDGARLLLPGHDYGGAAIFQGPSRTPVVSEIYNSKLFYINHDPNDWFDFDLAQNGEVEHPSGTGCCEKHWPSSPDLSLLSLESFALDLSTLKLSDNDETKDIFRDLPSEIIMLILCYLPTTSVSSLRLVSPSVARASRPQLLPQSFWSSRFSLNHEMEFAFASRSKILPPEPINWRRLYIAARTMIKDPNTYPGFQNRQRIWKALVHVLPALELRIKNENDIATTPYKDDMGISSFDRSSVVSGELTFQYPKSSLRDNGASTELDAGCRLFEKQQLDWTKAAATQSMVLGVSLLRHDGRTYISGFRLLPAGENCERNELDRAGLINTKNEQLLTLGISSTLKAVRVRVVPQGIIGLCLVLENPSGVDSHCFGDFGLADPESGVAELQSGAQLHSCTFIVGLDACKLVSLQLARVHPKGISSIRSLPDLKHTGRNADEMAEIWSPVVPTTSPSWRSPRPFPPQTFNRCLHVDFGGPNGTLLKTLVMINVFMGEFPHVFLGFSFIYCDGSERLFGHRSYQIRSARSYPCVVQSFSIAGGKGEVLQEIWTSYSRKNDTIQAVCFRTNFNRSREFRLFGTEAYDGECTVNSMIAPLGESISGFSVKLKSPHDQIRDLVVDLCTVSHAPSEENTTGISDIFSVSPFHLGSAQELLAYIGGFAFRTADLAGLRRIRFSGGIEGCSRGPEHMTGLQLEYTEDEAPHIIGQWLNGLVSFELEPDERLVEITTWHGIVNRFSRVKFGPLTRIEFVTSKGRRLINTQHKRHEDLVCLKYRENPYEKLDTIVWGCNFQWDHVRVLSTPKPERQTKRLILSPTARETPQWTVREKIFLEEQDSNGNADSVEFITITFKSLSDEPSGLSFMYRSGKTQVIGSEGERPCRQELQEGEKLTRMDVGILRANRLGSIAFHTDKNRELTFAPESRPVPAKRTVPSRVRPINMVQKVETHLLRRETSPGAAEESLNHSYNVPESAGDFVGLWAVPARKDGTLKYPLFGPIFETDIST
ncbi:hypothetical protein BKA67DRAFT_531583 [Truncatella angustata]|uniref:F-box domain-containing protein n=1 Tax=Truncatella angustata TaxID=152316 RepID=A0A9P8UP66_9PEZI|nr:uncharacterized protein BKA67DRAFT_531583 [Truncatella angustata]KAH6656305.1 hypothetical protein BKA67DRAFT_531583 [Truncatella angustata]KAH8202129.1 hypothetical protein TruAng_003707 [Truncatella angustata]